MSNFFDVNFESCCMGVLLGRPSIVQAGPRQNPGFFEVPDRMFFFQVH